MIIINQQKDEIINFNNVMNVNICGKDGEYIISAGVIIGIDDNYRELGVYKTEERAKDVLKEITEKYKAYGKIENGLGSVFNVFDYPKVYYMPEE